MAYIFLLIVGCERNIAFNSLHILTYHPEPKVQDDTGRQKYEFR